MGQGGQGQAGDPVSVTDRIASAAQRIVAAEKVTAEVATDVVAITEGKTPPINPATTVNASATVPDVAGKDVTAMNTLAPSDTAPGPVAEVHADFSADVALVRDQLGQVVTNFRSRIDSLASLSGDHDGVIKELATKVADLVKTAEDHSSQIEALVSALEAIK